MIRSAAGHPRPIRAPRWGPFTLEPVPEIEDFETLLDQKAPLIEVLFSIDAMIQKEPSEGEEQTDIILLTHLTIEKRVVDAIEAIESLPTVKGKVVRIRLEALN